MNKEGSKERNVDVKQGIWATGKFRKVLNKEGVVCVKGTNPGFGNAPYHVYLGLRLGESGPIHYGPLDRILGEGYRFDAKVSELGSFDIHLVAPDRSNQNVTIVWWASSQGCMEEWSPPYAGPTGGPTPPPPPPTIPPIGLVDVRFEPSDFPHLGLNEIGIDLESKLAEDLTAHGIDNLAALASANATQVRGMSGVSEVDAMRHIYNARERLLEEGQP